MNLYVNNPVRLTPQRKQQLNEEEIGMNLIISFDVFFDALTMGQMNIVEGIFGFGEQIIDDGGKIIIQREYTNSSPEVLAEFKSLEALRDWKKRLNLA